MPINFEPRGKNEKKKYNFDIGHAAVSPPAKPTLHREASKYSVVVESIFCTVYPQSVFGTISRDAKAEKLNMQQQQAALNGNTIPIRVITG